LGNISLGNALSWLTLTTYETEIISYCSFVRPVRAGAGRLQQFQRHLLHPAGVDKRACGPGDSALDKLTRLGGL
jgi:hypothetical protein